MLRHALFAALFVFTNISTIQTANADAAAEALVRDILNAIASRPGWSASSRIVRSEGNIVIVEGLAIANPGMKFNVVAEALALTGLRERGSGYAATSATVSDLNTDYDFAAMIALKPADGDKATSMVQNVTIEALDIAEIYLPGSIPSGSGHPGFISGILNAYAYLAAVEMKSLSAPSVDVVQTLTSPGLDQVTRTTYRDAKITDWSGGVIARNEFGRMDTQVSGGQTGSYSMGADSALVEHMDIGHVVHVLDPARYAGGRGDLVWKPVLKRAEYRGLRVNAAEANATIGLIGMSDFELRQPEKPFLAGLDDVIADGLAGREPDEEQILDMMRDLLPGLLDCFRLGDMRIEDVEVKPVESSEPTSFAMKEFSIAGYSGKGIDRILFSDLSGTGPGMKFRFDTMRLDRLGFPEGRAIVAFADTAKQIEGNPGDPKLGALFGRQLMEIYPTLDGFQLRDLSGNAPGKDPFTLEAVQIETTQRLLGFMVGGNGTIKGLVIPASYFDEGDGPNPLAMLEYDRFAMDLDFESVWNETTTDIDYTLNMQVEDVGDLTLGYQFSGFTDQAVEKLFEGAFALGAAGNEDIDKIVALFSDIGFRGFVLSFTDRSIVDRALTLASAQQGSDAQTYRGQLKAALPFFLSAMPPGDFRQQVIDAAQAALDGGRKTTFSLTPADVVMIPDIVIASMQDPLSLIGLLGAGMASQPAN